MSFPCCGRKVLEVCFDDDNLPVIPAVYEGRPMDLSQFDAFGCVTEFGDEIEFTPEEFFAAFLPTRLMFKAAGRG